MHSQEGGPNVFSFLGEWVRWNLGGGGGGGGGGGCYKKIIKKKK
jgi:hypothetical protein